MFHLFIAIAIDIAITFTSFLLFLNPLHQHWSLKTIDIGSHHTTINIDIGSISTITMISISIGILLIN